MGYWLESRFTTKENKAILGLGRDRLDFDNLAELRYSYLHTHTHAYIYVCMCACTCMCVCTSTKAGTKIGNTFQTNILLGF